jgi:hypothetical protein
MYKYIYPFTRITMTNSFYESLTKNYPFLTIITYAGNEYLGIMQNKDDTITSIYDYGSIIEQSLKEKFLLLGDEWWWSSNRLIPINIFLRQDWDIFKPYLKTFSNKGVKVIHGPEISMNDLSKKRLKKRSITLVKRMV